MEDSKQELKELKKALKKIGNISNFKQGKITLGLLNTARKVLGLELFLGLDPDDIKQLDWSDPEIEFEDKVKYYEVQPDNKMSQSVPVRLEYRESCEEVQYDETEASLLFQGTGAEDKKGEEEKAHYTVWI